MTALQPTVSVVVPVYNAVATIDDCIRSLLELRYPADRLELLVVDNGSTDGTLEALRRWTGRIAIWTEQRRGPAAARNAGLRAAGSELVAFTDADCVVDPGWLAGLVPALEDPAVGIAGGTILAQPPANDIERFGEVIHDHRQAIEVFRPPYAITMSWVSQREVLLAVGGFDERFRRAEDVDLSYRVIQAGYRLAFVPEAVVYHRNESTLAGLFGEGFAHGFHGVRATRRHHGYLAEFGHPAVNTRAYRAIGDGLVSLARGRGDHRSRCEIVFNAGKKTGKLAGSVRFGHIDL
jgi:GT2 family glycosyltransferase